MSPFALPGCPLSRFGRAVCLGLASLFAGLFLVASSVEPDPRGYGTHEQLGLPPCAFREILNIPCPTCGGTTSFAHFVRGQWGPSFQANSAVFVFAFLFACLTPWLALSAASGRLHGVASADWLVILIALLIAFLGLSHWLIRLLPFVHSSFIRP